MNILLKLTKAIKYQRSIIVIKFEMDTLVIKINEISTCNQILLKQRVYLNIKTFNLM